MLGTGTQTSSGGTSAVNITQIGGTALALGQALMAASIPVVIASDQGSLTVGTHAVTQSGTWTVQPGNTANTTAWKVDGSAVTQPVSGTVTANAGTGTMAVSNAGLTELAAAINASNQMDVNIAASGVTVPVSGTFWQATQPVSLASVPSHAVTNAGTFAVQADSVIPGTGATNLGKAIDTATGATDTGVLALVTRDDALSALTPIEGDNVQLRTDANGALWTHDDALDAALAGSELQVDVVGALPSGTNNIGDVDIVSGTVTTVTTLTGGGVAHDSADSGNPHKVGFKAFSPDGTTPGTAVAENDRTDAKADLDGRLYVNTVHPVLWSYHENSSNALTDTEVKADPGDGFSIFVTDIIFSTGAATACNIFFEEGASTVLGPYYLEATAGRGLAIHFTTPKKITASTALTVTTSAAIAHGLDVLGYVSAV